MNNKFDQNKRSIESSNFLPLPPPFLLLWNEMKYHPLLFEISSRKPKFLIKTRIHQLKN